MQHRAAIYGISQRLPHADIFQDRVAQIESQISSNVPAAAQSEDCDSGEACPPYLR